MKKGGEELMDSIGGGWKSKGMREGKSKRVLRVFAS